MFFSYICQIVGLLDTAYKRLILELNVDPMPFCWKRQTIESLFTFLCSTFFIDLQYWSGPHCLLSHNKIINNLWIRNYSGSFAFNANWRWEFYGDGSGYFPVLVWPCSSSPRAVRALTWFVGVVFHSPGSICCPLKSGLFVNYIHPPGTVCFNSQSVNFPWQTAFWAAL